MKKIIAACFFIPLFLTVAQSDYINLDEDFTDWETIPVAFADEQYAEHTYDFKEFRITNDQNHIFFLLLFHNEVLLQADNNVTVYIDFDNNPTTGRTFETIGAELEFNFGEKRGTIYFQDGISTITHFDIGLTYSPTTTSSIFEIAINRGPFEPGLSPLDTIRVLWSGGNGVADSMPNDGSGISYVMQNIISEIAENNLAKTDNSDLRVLCYNVHRDDIFDSSEQPSFERQLKAINPDIIGFQEIYQHSSQDVASLMDSWLPIVNGSWYHAKANPDIIVVSRFPILISVNVGSNGAFLIDLTEQYQRELLIVNAHPPCCDNDTQRQDEIDEFMKFVRDSKNQIGDIPLNPETPIVVMGDMNLVGYSEQQRTLLEGDIKNNEKYGEDFSPDWDNSAFEDSKPGTTGRPNVFTWYSEGELFSPGRLDYIVYSGSVMEKKNSYVLFTKGINNTQLAELGLEADDNINSSDHLPVVADFEFKQVTGVALTSQIPGDLYLSQNYPNPFNPTTNIRYSVPVVALSPPGRQTGEAEVQHVTLKIYDILGNEVSQLVNKSQAPGIYQVEFNASNLSSGIYFYKLAAGRFTESKKMMLVK